MDIDYLTILPIIIINEVLSVILLACVFKVLVLQLYHKCLVMYCCPTLVTGCLGPGGPHFFGQGGIVRFNKQRGNIGKEKWSR